MKSLLARTATILTSGLGLALFLFATSGIGDDRVGVQNPGIGAAPPRPAPGYNLENSPGIIGRPASDNRGAPGYDSQNNPGVKGSEFGRSTAQDASNSGASPRDSGGSSFTLGKREETVVETATSNVPTSEHATEAVSGKPEAKSPFKGSLLNEGLPSSGNANGHTEPKPTPRGHHYGWEKGKQNPHRAAVSPTPNATVSPSPGATATPTPSASVTPIATPTPTS